MPSKNPVDRAIETLKTDRELARRVGVTPAAVVKWRKAERIPTDRLIQVSAVSGVPIRELDETARLLFAVMKAQEATH